MALHWIGVLSHDIAVCADWRTGVLSPPFLSLLSSDRDLGGVSVLGVEVPRCLSADLDLGGVLTLGGRGTAPFA